LTNLEVLVQPENLLLSSRDADASVKVADFGFAKKSVSDLDLTALVGTPPYMGAPPIHSNFTHFI